MNASPVDRLIRELIETRRPATAAEVETVARRIAEAPFERAVKRVPLHLRVPLHGRMLSSREEALLIHLAKRTLDGSQWHPATTLAEYVRDIRAAVQPPHAQVLAYTR